MTPQEVAEENAARVVDACRRIFRRAAEKMESEGVRLEDVAIAVALAAEDVAVNYKGGDHHGAIEWLRTALDVQERALLDRAAH